MSVRPFDPSAPIALGRTVIEASAGTGKTFTIAALVARLVATEGLDIERILVVTFTRAATAEVRGRVRRRLVDSFDALTAGTPPETGDRHLDVLLAAPAERRRRYQANVAAALARFDRAQVFTIHAFAHRLLRQLGFAARLPPDLEPGEVDEALIAETAGDLLVARFAGDAAGVIDPEEARRVGEAVVATPDARIVPDPEEVDGRPRVRVEVARAMRGEVRRRLFAVGAATFDDALVEARRAFQDPAVGAVARELVKSRYTVGLVDESQDTDPIQWQVIRAVFDDARLVVIGDPKQSIYSFRGADVEAYLSAVAGADDHRTLDVNWRSDAVLIKALDTLMRGATFGDDRIAYHPVAAPAARVAARIHGVAAPLSIRRFDDTIAIRRRRNGRFLVGEAREVVAADAAAEVVRLLSGGVTVEVDGAPTPLGPEHVAVLCRTRKQVDMVRAELGRRRVPSVAARTGAVFASEAAEQWRRFLVALERPDRGDMARLAATTVFVGKSPHEVVAMEDAEVLALQARMREWQACLHQDGVPGLLAAIDRRTDLAARVLATVEGERLMTDLVHIAEEMHVAWRRGRAGSLVTWLEAAMAEAASREAHNREEPESRQRRLETDAAAVQVQTVHGAKGLEYPVVLVPFAWDVPRFRNDTPVFHDPDVPPGPQPRPRLIDVGGPEWPGYEAHAALRAREDEAEESRQLYVALTRAKHHLVVWWLPMASGSEDTKLGELMTRLGPDPVTLVAAGEGTIEVPVVADLPPVAVYEPAPTERSPLERADFTRRLDYEWRRASFTSLSPEHPLIGVAETSEQPLRRDETGIEDGEAEAPPGAARALPMAELPRGARFGTLVHEIFEVVDFAAGDLDAALRHQVEAALRRTGWELDADLLATALRTAIETPLGPDGDAVRLRDLAPHAVLKELSFEFPVRTGGGAMSLRDVAAVMLDHLGAKDPYRAYAESLAETVAPVRFRGFLTGAIDLTAVVDGRYEVMDFKTNPMPASGDVAAPEDYGPQPLTEAMVAGNYLLQATLYQVALHRYLQWRLPGYAPERHLGGARYLFVRGMAGAEAPVVDGERCGVVRWAPPVEMIPALSRVFAGEEEPGR